MNIINVKVNFEKGTCETTGINLITGDYNSTKMIFNFDRDTGTKVFEMKSPSEQLVMVQEIQNNEIILYGLDEDENIASIFNEEGYYIFEISLYENESKLTSAKGKIKVKPEQVIIDDEVVEVYLPIFDQLMQQVTTAITETNNLDLDMNNDDGVVTATLTKKDGTTKEVEIIDTGDYYTKDEVDSIKTTIEGEIPTKVSQLTNDSAFINKEVNNLTYYTLATGTGSTIELSINSSTYVMTLNLKNSAGTTISTGSIDLPLETMVVDGSYDSTNKKIVLELDNGNTIDIPVGDLISGLQTEITNSNKLSSDLVDDTGHTNKFVTSSDKTTWNAKYDKPSGGIPKTDLASAVQTSLGKADTAVQDVSGKEDIINKVTTISESSTDTQYPSAKCVYDSQVAQDTLIEDLQTEKDYMESIINQLPKVSGTGTSITLDNTIQAKMNMVLNPSTLQQTTTSISGGDEYDSPSPDHPQDIHTISGDNSIVVSGKNLCNTFIATKPSWQAGTLVVNSDGSFIVSGNTGSNNYFSLNQKVRVLCPSLKAGDVVYLYLETTNTNKKIYASGMGGGGWYSGNSLTITDTILNNNLVIYGGYNQTDTIKITITKEQVATEYVPYQEAQTAQLNLPVENLFDKDNIQWYRNNNSNFSNTTDTSTTRIRTNSFAIKGGKTYTISGIPTGITLLGVRTYEVNSGDSTGDVTRTDNTFTLGANVNYIHFLFQGSDFTSATNTLMANANIMLEKGTKANSYTPYGTTPIEYCKIPNTDYKDDFILTSGKNKYNATTSETTASNVTYSANEIILQVNGTRSSEGYINFEYFTLPAGTYTLNVKLTKGSITNRFYITLADSNNTEYVSSFEFKSDNNYTNSKSFTLSEEKSLRFKLYVFKNNTFSNAELSYQVTTGSASDYDFEPYGTNQWYLKKNIGKYVANNDLIGNGITTDRIRLLTPELNITPNLSNDNLEVMSKCNLMPTKMAGNTNNNGLQGTTSVNKIRVNLNTTYADSTENANIFLTNNNFTIYYVLSTPTYTQITGTLETQLNNIHEKLLSYKGTTNISQVNNDLPFVITSSAIMDLNNLITRIEILESEV